MRRKMGFRTRSALKVAAVAMALIAAAGEAPAQYACPPGYLFFGGVCQPGAYSNPLWGAAGGMGNGAAAGAATAGPVGAVVGAAFGVVTGALAGTANAVTNGFAGVPFYPSDAPPPPSYWDAPPAATCPSGLMLYHGACYPARD